MRIAICHWKETACPALHLSSFYRGNNAGCFAEGAGATDGAGQHGSRYADGNVPNVNWNPSNRKVYVNWYHPDDSNADLRARAEVSRRPAIMSGASSRT